MLRRTSPPPLALPLLLAVAVPVRGGEFALDLSGDEEAPS